METIAKIRRMYHVQKKGFKAIARELNLSKNTVKKIIRKGKASKNYERAAQSFPALDKFIDRLTERLESDATEPKRRRRTAKKLYDELCAEGFSGSYSAINRFVQNWKQKKHKGISKAFVPLEFDAGKAFQFDWSEEEIKLKGELTRVKAAHIRLCYSRFFLIVVYRNEQLEMVMDAHDKAFQFFDGVPQKGIYDNMRTAVKKVLTGKDREFNTRFAEMASHYLFEPIACTPAAGWEKGQVENQVSTARNNFFTPLRCVESLDELNKKLHQECLDWAKNKKHPEIKGKTVWEMYEGEKSYLLSYRFPFDAYKIEHAIVSSYSLVSYGTNMYSVYCDYVGNVAEIRIYAKKIVIVYKNEIIGEHERSFGKHERIYNPWHYVAVLERKPGALRDGAPFKNWDLPTALSKIRITLEKYPGGEKEFIKLLLQVSSYGLQKVNEGCVYALERGIGNVDFIIDYLSGNNKEEKTTEDEYIGIQTLPDKNCQHYTKQLLIVCEEVGHA